VEYEDLSLVRYPRHLDGIASGLGRRIKLGRAIFLGAVVAYGSEPGPRLDFIRQQWDNHYLLKVLANLFR
jgi:hypothetical protein